MAYHYVRCISEEVYEGGISSGFNIHIIISYLYYHSYTIYSFQLTFRYHLTMRPCSRQISCLQLLYASYLSSNTSLPHLHRIQNIYIQHLFFFVFFSSYLNLKFILGPLRCCDRTVRRPCNGAWHSNPENKPHPGLSLTAIAARFFFFFFLVNRRNICQRSNAKVSLRGYPPATDFLLGVCVGRNGRRLVHCAGHMTIHR